MDFTDLINCNNVEHMSVFKNQFVFIESKDDQSMIPSEFCEKIKDKIKQFSTRKVVYLIENYKHWSNIETGNGYIADYLDRNHIYIISCVDPFTLFREINRLSHDMDVLRKIMESIKSPYCLINFIKTHTVLGHMDTSIIPESELVRMIQSVLHKIRKNDDNSIMNKLKNSYVLLSKYYFKYYHRFLRTEDNQQRKEIFNLFLTQLKSFKIIFKDFLKIMTIWKMMYYLKTYPSCIFIIHGSKFIIDEIKYAIKFSTNDSQNLKMFNHI